MVERPRAALGHCEQPLLSEPSSREPPTICIMAISRIADDPRVRRQADAFHRAGWRVVAIGMPGARSPAPEWRVLTCEDFSADNVRRRSYWSRTRRAFRQVAVRVRPALAQKLYWTIVYRANDIYHCAAHINAAVWLANDWNMLPVAARLAREKGGIYGYDTHEFAIEEFAESRKWRLFGNLSSVRSNDNTSATPPSYRRFLPA